MKQIDEQATAKLLGSNMLRQKSQFQQRNSTNEENQFIKKAQEMMHSFAEDDLSKSVISANKTDRMSVFSGGQKADKEDPVIIDWNAAMSKTKASEKYKNRKDFRQQASLHDAEHFLSQQVSQLDAVNEVDSQINATPMNVLMAGKASTPRDVSGLSSKIEPNQLIMNRMFSQHQTEDLKKKPLGHHSSFSPMRMVKPVASVEGSELAEPHPEG